MQWEPNHGVVLAHWPDRLGGSLVLEMLLDVDPTGPSFFIFTLFAFDFLMLSNSFSYKPTPLCMQAKALLLCNVTKTWTPSCDSVLHAIICPKLYWCTNKRTTWKEEPFDWCIHDYIQSGLMRLVDAYIEPIVPVLVTWIQAMHSRVFIFPDKLGSDSYRG
jgi:hypothetical protein